MRHPTLALSIVSLLAACSPAAPPPVVAQKPAPTVKPPPPPPPTAARWVFPESASYALAQVPLDKGVVLQVGDQGRRWTMEGGKVKSAETLAIGTLVDVRLDDGKPAFLGSDGVYQVADTPLGPLVRRGESPGEKVRGFRMGQKALLGVTLDGTLLRAADPAAKWTSSKLPLQPHERVSGLETDRKGRVLVLISPQRLLASSDDGASFAPLLLPGIGAEGLGRDANNDLFLRGGFGLTAKLDGGKFDTTQKPVPLAKNDASEKEEGYTHLTLAGDRAAALTTSYKGGKRKIEVALGPIDGALGPRHLLVDTGGSEVVVGGHGDRVVFALEDYDGDPAVRVFQTTDDGKTIEPIGSFEGRPEWPFRVEAGPKGWTMVSGSCDDVGSCTAPHVRIAGAWKVLSESVRPTRLAIDAKNERAYLWDQSGHRLVWVGLADTHVTEVGVEMKEEPIAMTVDEAGTLRILHGSPLRLTRVPSSGGAQAALYPPFSTYAVAFAGSRGLATAVGGGGWETMDGGEHWTRVAVAGYGDLHCSKGGCVAGNALRVGWDVPAIGGEQVAASDEPKVKDKEPPKPPMVGESQAKLDCTYEEKWTKLDGGYGVSAAVGGVGDVRFLEMPYLKDGSLAVQVGRAGAPPKVIKLLDKPTAKDKTVRGTRAIGDRGAVVANFAYGPKTPEGAYSPVDVELGFYDSASGKTGKVKIPQVKPFRVGRVSVSALLQPVDGGVLFAPDNDDAPIYFARLDGKVDSIPRPPKGASGGRYRAAIRVGKQIVLSSYGSSSSMELVSTKDLGKTWTRTIWTIGPAELVVVGNVPMVMGTHDGLQLYGLDVLGPDLPPAKLLARVKAPALAACDSKALGGIRISDYIGQNLRVSVSVAKGKGAALELTGSRRISQLSLEGKACTGVLAAAGAAGTAIIAPHDLTHGYLVKEHDGVLSSAALSCKSAP